MIIECGRDDIRGQNQLTRISRLFLLFAKYPSSVPIPPSLSSHYDQVY